MRTSMMLMLLAGTLVGCRDKGDTGAVLDGDPIDSETEWSLTISGPESGVAGEALTWSAAVTDESGGELAADLLLQVYDAGGSVVAESAARTFTPTIADTYTVSVTATLDDAQQTEELPLTVSAGALAGISLSMSALSAEIGESVTGAVTGVDAYGNSLGSVDADLSADLTDGVDITGLSATFAADGAYTFTAESDGMTASDGPVLVDSAGPLVVLTSPARGAWIEGSSVTVTGTVTDAVTEVASLTLNEAAVTVEADGSFSHDLDLEAGANLLSFAATDTDGNTADSVAGILAGSFSSADIDGAIEAHLNQGALETIASVLIEAFDVDDIEDELLAANPIVSDSLGCVDIDIDATGLSLGTPTAAVTPTADGLTLVLSAADLDLDMDIEVDVCGFYDDDTDGEIAATDVEIEVEIALAVAGPGDFDVEVTSTTVTFTDFTEDFGTLSSVLSAFGYTVSDLGIDTEGLVEEELVAAIEDVVPAALEASLESVAISETLGILDAEATLDAQVTALSTTTDGLTLMMTAAVTADGTSPDIPTSPGSLILGGDAPDYASEPGLYLGLSLDALNRILEKLWEAGGVSTTITSDELGLNEAIIELVFPGVSALTLELYPQLPPVLVPAEGDHPLALDIAELQVEIWGEADGSTSLLTTAAVHLTAGATPALVDTSITLEIAEAALTLDVITEDAAAVGEAEYLEGLLGVATGGLADSLLPEIAVTLPDLVGFSMETEGVEVGGDAADWIVVSAELETAGR